MPAERHYYVYMLASKTRRLYVGMINDLTRRVWQHRTKAIEGFTSKYNIDRLVWYETTGQVVDAIAREHQIKSWRREKKIELIEAENPSGSLAATIAIRSYLVSGCRNGHDGGK